MNFFSSLLTVNDYWNSLAKKFWGKEMMSHPYKDDVIKFFSKFKTDDVFTVLENFCASLNDFSVLLEIPFLIPKEIHRLCLWCDSAFYTDSN